MHPLLDKLHDIDGLDLISAWPLGIGWWVVIALVAFLGVILFYYAISRWIFSRSWKGDALRKLTALEKHLTPDTARKIAIDLSEYLRRIAVRRFPRKECASLIGEPWLIWLSQHDPKQFDWKKNASLLLSLPYSPQHASVSVEQVRALIQATKNWVR